MISLILPRPVLSGGRGRRFKSSHSDQFFQTLSDKIAPTQTGKNKNNPVYRVTVLARRGGAVASLFLATALVFERRR